MSNPPKKCKKNNNMKTVEAKPYIEKLKMI